MPMPSPETRASRSSAGTLLSTVMLLAIIVTTTWLRTGVAHDIVRRRRPHFRLAAAAVLLLPAARASLSRARGARLVLPPPTGRRDSNDRPVGKSMPK